MSEATVRPARLVYSRALGWLGRARSGFALPEGVTAAQIPVQALKSVAELGLAMSLIEREAVAGAEDAQAARQLAEFAWGQLEGGVLLYRRQLIDPASSFPMEVYASFVRAGYRHQPLTALCAHLVGLRGARVRELAPHDQLAVVAAARQLGNDERGCGDGRGSGGGARAGRTRLPGRGGRAGAEGQPQRVGVPVHAAGRARQPAGPGAARHALGVPLEARFHLLPGMCRVAGAAARPGLRRSSTAGAGPRRLLPGLVHAPARPAARVCCRFVRPAASRPERRR